MGSSSSSSPSASPKAPEETSNYLQEIQRSLGLELGVLVLDTDLRVLFINETARRMTHTEKRKAVGEMHEDIFPASKGLGIEDQYRRVLAEKVAVSFTVYYPPLSAHFEITALPIQNGLTIYFNNSRGPSLDRKPLIAPLSSVIWSTNSLGEFAFSQPLWNMFTGQTDEEAKGCGWLSAIHESDRNQFMDIWAEARSQLNSFEFRGRVFARQQNEYRITLMRILPNLVTSTTDGTLVEWIGSLVDITEQSRVEEDLKKKNAALRFAQAQLREANDKANAANRSKTIFLANVSHEIRTPLGALLGFSELASESNSIEEMRSYIQIIQRNAKHLSELLDDVLDLAKIEEERLEIERVNVPLIGILQDVISAMQLRAENKQLRLSYELEGALPEMIETDPLRLKQILLNLIGNSIKFTDRGEVKIIVREDLSTQANQEARLCFEISDTGIGMTAEQLDKLFKPFSQADSSTSRRYGGTGLGLYLSRMLAEALDGELKVTRTEVGKGSSFTLNIRCKVRGERLASKVVQPIQQSPAIPNLNGMRVLLVEDSRDNQALISRILMPTNVKLDIANNGAEGIKMALAGSYDLVLMDIQMPEVDGFEATAALREKRFSPPIIALTAHALKEERDRALTTGFNEYLTKPIHRIRLFETLSSFRKSQSSSDK